MRPSRTRTKGRGRNNDDNKDDESDNGTVLLETKELVARVCHRQSIKTLSLNMITSTVAFDGSVSEWLRSGIANPVLFERESSNLFAVDLLFVIFQCFPPQDYY
jgi:hypothetical protein